MTSKNKRVLGKEKTLPEISNLIRTYTNNLEIVDMPANEDLDVDIIKSEVGTCEVKSKFSVSQIKPFESKLIQRIAASFGCKVLFKKSNSYNDNVFGTYTLIGLKSQTEIACYVCDIMTHKLMKARTNFVKDLKLGKEVARTSITKEADGFCQGWVDSIIKVIYVLTMSEEAREIIDVEFKARSYGKLQKVQHRELGQMGFQEGVREVTKEVDMREILDNEK